MASLYQRIRQILFPTKEPMQFLIAGLGNKGAEYKNTRHNIGFEVVDKLASDFATEFDLAKQAWLAEFKFKGKPVGMIKPSTYMNLSGKAVRYWLTEGKVKQENLLVIVDDLALPFGTIRIKGKGSPGGHNGLKNIDQLLGNSSYARLRIGIGDNYRKGQQVDYVLGQWTKQEQEELPFIIDKAADAVKSFIGHGLNNTMSNFNRG